MSNKKKDFRQRLISLVVIAFVMALLAPVLMATPASATATLQVVPFTLATTGTGTAQWTNLDHYTGSYAVSLTTSSPGDSSGVGISAYTGTINSITSLSVWYKDVVYDTYSGPRISLALVNGSTNYLAVTGCAIQSAVWKQADAVNGVSATDWYTPGTGNQIWWYGTWDGATFGSYSPLGGPISFTALQSAITGSTVQYASAYMGVVDGTNVKAGSAYVDDPEINGTTYYGMIQDAVDAASSGNTINVAAGTYGITSNIAINKSVSIIGDPTNKPVVQALSSFDTGSGGTSNYFFRCDPAVTAVINISNIVLDGNGYDVYGGMRFYPTHSGTIENCVFQHLKDPGYQGFGIVDYGSLTIRNNVFTDIGRVGIWVGGPNNLVLNNNYTGKGAGDWLDYGIEVGAGGTATITSNAITSCTGVASVDSSTSGGILVSTYYGTGTQADISNNTITGNTDGIAVGYDASDTSVVTAHHNNISGNAHGIDTTSTTVTVDATCNWWGSTDPTTVAGNISGTVDFTPLLNSGTDTDLGTPGFQPSLSSLTVHTLGSQTGSTGRIQEGINLVSGSTVNVAAGAYTENVNVNKSLTLQGASSATVTVTAAINTASVFTVTASNVNISGFTATGTQITGNQGYAGIKFGSGVTNCNIHDNIVSGNQYGILLIEPLSNTTPGNNTFTNNTASNCGVSGIEMQNTWNNTFTNNTANSNGSQGFRLANAKNNTFTGNTANSTLGTTGGGGACGFFLVVAGGTGSNGNTFTNNIANSNPNHGFRMDGSTGNILTGNTFNSNGADGIKLKTGSNNNTLNNNTCSHNAIGIDIATADIAATSLTVTDNNIAGNTSYGVSNGGTGTLNAENNWWGNASGPDDDAGVINGTGDKISTNVDADPWVGEPEPYAPTKSTETATFTGAASFTPDSGALEDLVAVNVATLPPPPTGVSLPHGLFSFRITGVGSGATVTVTITLPSAVPTGTLWYKYDASVGWSSLPIGSDNGDNVITINIKDGGTGDFDPTPGAILDPGGTGNPPATPTPPPPASTSLSVGGTVQFPVDGSHSSSPPYAVIIGGSIAALAALAVGFWFARRRWLRRCS